MAIARVKYARSMGFRETLKSRVDAYFEQTGLSPRYDSRMYRKTLIVFLWTAASYVYLVFFSPHWAISFAAAVSLGFAMASIGFNVMHDGNHSAYSSSPGINALMGASLDMLGGSSYLWRWKHNTFHHQYTNIQGLDDDIDLGILCKMAPDQPWHPPHQFQHIYAWALYCLMVPKWHLFDDFAVLVKARIGAHDIPRPKGRDLAIFWGGKVVFFSLAFIIPMLLYPWWVVFIFYLFVTSVLSLTLSLVFQLAHCTDDASFTPGSNEPRRLEEEWAVHQVETTVNFASKNKFLSWYTGSLNHQIEHHLFPRICHVHLPAIASIIKEVCKEYGIQYAEYTSVKEALAAHYAWLFKMGRPAPVMA